MKGVRPAELLGGASVMRELATRVTVADQSHLVDTCGTGGSGSNKFNVSTASALVAATAGAKVAKHGNRGATSKAAAQMFSKRPELTCHWALKRSVTASIVSAWVSCLPRPTTVR